MAEQFEHLTGVIDVDGSLTEVKRRASLEKELDEARSTIRTLTAVLEQAEQHVEDRDQRIGELAADRLELRSQRAHLARENERLADELAQANATIVRLTNEDIAEKDPSAYHSPLSCQTCGSPQPSMHPAIGGGGEVTHVCPDAFHGAAPGGPFRSRS